MVKVEKKDGSLQDFDKSKISSSLERVGLDPSEAQKVADEAEVWVASSALDGVVKSSQIRNRVLDVIPPKAAQEYMQFEKEEKGG